VRRISLDTGHMSDEEVENWENEPAYLRKQKTQNGQAKTHEISDFTLSKDAKRRWY